MPIDRILSVKNVQAWVSMDFTSVRYSAPKTIEKMKSKFWTKLGESVHSVKVY